MIEINKESIHRLVKSGPKSAAKKYIKRAQVKIIRAEIPKAKWIIEWGNRHSFVERSEVTTGESLRV